ncbi:MAG: iron ABC transporter permease [Bacteroidetes bacterium]|nr:iron ABC transporter permease [Bacteroidota bacterium]MCL4816595.1 iron ABC transporter permease [Flavobacteriales bacterium]NOG95640.1 iron ABC transporter permease [Bacteroidota bacterium]CAG0998233.1 Hemin transport system permease protein HmuU [Flavobacteriales bacterium]
MRTSKKYIVTGLFLILLIILLSCELMLGSVYIPAQNVFSVLTNNEHQNEVWNTIILQSRLPRALGAIIAGASLSVSGLLMQVLFRNPLASPYILGISSGAGLGVALITLGSVGIGFTFVPNGLSLVASAMLGALLVFSIVFFISLKVKDVMTLLIAGVLIGSIANAVVNIIQLHASALAVKTFVLWTLASLDQLEMTDIKLLYIICPLTLIGSFLLSKQLNALLMGEKYARSVGVNILLSRILIILFSGILAASITAFCGPIGFIGIMVPHIVRIIFRTNHHKLLILFSVLIGSCTLLAADLMAHYFITSVSLPINAITALIGIPVILWLLLGKKDISKTI